VTGVNAVIRQSVGRITDGCSDPAVELRMVVTLLWKNVANSFALLVGCVSVNNANWIRSQ